MRIHYSSKEIKRLVDTLPESKLVAERVHQLKPEGLWYSFDKSNITWRDWCESEGFRSFDQGVRCYRLDVDESKILMLTPDTLDDFNKEYSISWGLSSYHSTIHWQLVGMEYAGIEINPYSWHHRLESDFFWYYGWDCASGCIWRPSEAITSIEEIDPCNLQQRPGNTTADTAETGES